MNTLTPNLRALLLIGPHGMRGATCAEYFILEISPSGNFVKVANLYGNHFWKPISEVELVEVLPYDPDISQAKHPETT